MLSDATIAKNDQKIDAILKEEVELIKPKRHRRTKAELLAAQATVRGKPLGNNPKDLLGIKKVSPSKLPPVGIVHGSHGMMHGAKKYGPYNWRDNAVIASIYYDAIMRHVMAWYDSEDIAPDSGVTHLGHIIANASILLDAAATGNLVDDRPKGGKTPAILEALNTKIKEAANG